MPELSVLIDELKHKLRNAIPKVINADNPSKEPDYNPGMNILIGGNRLGRGVTIDGLMITYYPHSALLGGQKIITGQVHGGGSISESYC